MNPLNLQFGLILLVVLVVFAFGALMFLMRRTRRDIDVPDKFDELYKKISEEIKYAVAPKSINLSVGVSELVELATEVWRIEQRLMKVTESLPETQRKGLENSVHKLKTYVSKYDIEIIDYTNKKFNDGLNLDVLSVEKDPSVSTPMVKETIEPTILVKGQVVKKAKIILLSN